MFRATGDEICLMAIYLQPKCIKIYQETRHVFNPHSVQITCKSRSSTLTLSQSRIFV